ncbi:MAG: histidinol dehydrogenase [Thermoleophilia bacterium]|nr:histidinol dehydrogenase [Thermoleophilia bacterium]
MKILELSKNTVEAAVAGLRPGQEADREVARIVADIISQVRARGDAALVELSARFDWPEANVAALAVSEEELEAAYRQANAAFLSALSLARDNLKFFHEQELEPDWEVRGPQGQKLGVRSLPVERAGLYVPGGLASYASTVVMNAVPAQVAGVQELVLCTPARRDGSVNPSVLAAACLLGIRQVFRVGGAQAIAAMAYGTQSIPSVDVICGPGNAYVMEAKRQVQGVVGIDSLAGPSEVVVVADSTARADWIAADLLAQEEHGSGAQAVLLAETRDMCVAVAEHVKGLSERVQQQIATAGVQEPGYAMYGQQISLFYPAPGEDFLSVAELFVNRYAPEHLELHLSDARDFLGRVRSAGAVFLGAYSATAFGDYVVGSNHVLPTGGTARFCSPLSVQTFLRRSTVVEVTKDAAAALAEPLAMLADSEGFAFHRLSAEMRKEEG